MKRKVFLAVALVALVAVGAFAQTESEWSLTGDPSGGFAIDRYMGKGGAVTIPESIGNRKITAIGSFPFSNSLPVTSLTIPASITALRQGAFTGIAQSLTSITFQGKMADAAMASDVFNGMGDLRAKYLAGGAGTYTKSGSGTSAVWTKQGAAAQAPDAQYAPESDFQITKSGNAVTIVEYTGSAAAVTIPPRIQNLPVTVIGDGAFTGNHTMNSVTIPSGVTSIGGFAFSTCSSLTSVTIPATVTSLGNAAFNTCINLTNVTIGSGVRSIGLNAFGSNRNLTSVTFQGAIPASGLHEKAFGSDAAGTDLRAKYLAGGAGTYTRPANGTTWTKK